MGLINEDKLDDYVFKSASERMDLSVEYMSGWNDAIHHIKANAPTVDAEPVIRCKDCKYCPMNLHVLDHMKESYVHCFSFKENDYCSWAEREEE